MFKQLGLLWVLACVSCASIVDAGSKQYSLDEYQHLSKQLLKKDELFIRSELTKLGQKKAALPDYTKEFGFDVEQPVEWFTSDEGKRIMDIILSFQTPSGGWSKRTDMAKEKRKPGYAFGTEEDYVPTFDNSATSTQLMLLAKAYSLTENKNYLIAFNRGLDYVMSAQFPNGGWPQSFPLRGSYHDHITYNDALMRDLMVLMLKVSKAKDEFSFVTKDQQAAAKKSLDMALDCVLKTQVKVNGELTVWGAQHDVKTLAPAKARAYEMVSLTSSESVWMLEFLMELENPSSDIVQSIHAAAKWYEQTKIIGKTWVRGANQLTDNASAPALWSRFYEIGTNKPIFGDRDDAIYYEIGKVSEERRAGYAWFTTSPNNVLKKYQKWKKKHFSLAQNPLNFGNNIRTADPSGHVWADRKMYLYTSHDEECQEDFHMKDWYAFSSDDLVKWKTHGPILSIKDLTWADNFAWAPDAAYKNGKYYLIFPAGTGFKDRVNPEKSTKWMGLGVAVSDSPTGPFKDAIGKPLWRTPYANDPSLFIDDDGKAYLYFHGMNADFQVAEMADDLLSIKGDLQKMDMGGYQPKMEGPWVFKRKGIYYFTMPENNRTLSYYTSRSPKGPWQYQGVIMDEENGNNHHSIVEYKGHWILFYHRWFDTPGCHKKQRHVAAEYLFFTDDGKIQKVNRTQQGVSDFPKRIK